MDHETEGDGAKKILVKIASNGADTHHMPIPHRSFVNKSGSTEDTPNPDRSDDGPDSRSSILPTAKRNVIKPDADFKIDTPPPESEKLASPKFMDTKPPAKKAAAPVPVPAETKEESTDDGAILGNALNTDVLPIGQKQAEMQTAEDEKHQEEIEGIIESHKYFVPVNLAAERRSDKRNLGLTLVILILAIVLVDLMLDSGTIVLLQKVPHTHFFSINSKSK